VDVANIMRQEGEQISSKKEHAQNKGGTPCVSRVSLCNTVMEKTKKWGVQSHATRQMPANDDNAALNTELNRNSGAFGFPELLREVPPSSDRQGKSK